MSEVQTRINTVDIIKPEKNFIAFAGEEFDSLQVQNCYYEREVTKQIK